MSVMEWRFWLRRAWLVLLPVVLATWLLVGILGLLGVTGWAVPGGFVVGACAFATMMACLILEFVTLCVHEANMRRTAAYGIRAKATVLKVRRTRAITEYVGEYVRYMLQVHPPDSWPPFRAECFEVIYYRVYDLVPGKTVDVAFDPETEFVVIPDMQLPIPSGDIA